jgi:hypothetical protein
VKPETTVSTVPPALATRRTELAVTQYTCVLDRAMFTGVAASLASTQAPHNPLEQLPLWQSWPQAPQLSASVFRFASQPLLFTPSQSAYPDAHAIEQEPPEQVGVP